MAEQLTPATQSGEMPQMLPALAGEWSFMNTTNAPPSTGQIRLNQATQNLATLLWVHRTSALGADASGMLAAIKAEQIIRIDNRDDATRWQSYVVSGTPLDKSTYWEIPVAWKAGGVALAQQRVLLSSTGIQVQLAGLAATASVGTTTIFTQPEVKHVSIAVNGLAMSAETGTPSTDTVRFLPGYAFPGTSPDGVSLGMTLRQWYAGQAIVGFVSSNPAANLIGRLPQFCFRLADSMIAFEADEMAGVIVSPIPTAQPPRGQQTPPVPVPVAPTQAEAQALSLRRVR